MSDHLSLLNRTVYIHGSLVPSLAQEYGLVQAVFIVWIPVAASVGLMVSRIGPKLYTS